jgi:hypothetical protein
MDTTLAVGFILLAAAYFLIANGNAAVGECIGRAARPMIKASKLFLAGGAFCFARAISGWGLCFFVRGCRVCELTWRVQLVFAAFSCPVSAIHSTSTIRVCSKNICRGFVCFAEVRRVCPSRSRLATSVRALLR